MDKNRPFQTYDDVTDAAQCAPRLAALRAELESAGWTVSSCRAPTSIRANTCPPAERLAWLTGFTGSAGVAVVLTDKAAVFVDGRYTLQVRDAGRHQAVRAARPGGGRPARLDGRTMLPKGAKLGYDPWLHTAHGVEALRAACEKAGATLVPVDSNPIDAVWTDQPAAADRDRPCRMPSTCRACRARPSASASASSLKKAGADAAVITLARSICWLLNIRGGDVPHTPFRWPSRILHDDGSADLFMDPAKRNPELMAHLGNCGAGAQSRPVRRGAGRA